MADLTSATGMSRSAFSSRFKRFVGTGVLDYLLRWRMQLAAKELRTSAEPISSIAFSLGYESESAFGNAFKSVMGNAPKWVQREAYGYLPGPGGISPIGMEKRIGRY
jgi:AraC-like DNA-binding protein